MIHVVATAQEAQKTDMKGATAVVIDVLRATSTMTVAVHNGANGIVAVKSPDEAFRLKSLYPEGSVLLGGERHADKIEGFDLDNSPLSYTSNVVCGKTIVMTTTNGTLAIDACKSVDRLFISSFLNVNSVVNKLKSVVGDVYVVCAGTEGRFTIEDGLCAGYIVNALEGEKSDLAIALQEVYVSYSDDISRVVAKGEHFSRLIRKGYGCDLDVCFSDIRDYDALEYVNGVITKS